MINFFGGVGGIWFLRNPAVELLYIFSVQPFKSHLDIFQTSKIYIKYILLVWRRGWDLNPRMTVLQTAPLDHLGTTPNQMRSASLAYINRLTNDNQYDIKGSPMKRHKED